MTIVLGRDAEDLLVKLIPHDRFTVGFDLDLRPDDARSTPPAEPLRTWLGTYGAFPVLVFAGGAVWTSAAGGTPQLAVWDLPPAAVDEVLATKQHGVTLLLGGRVWATGRLESA